MSAIKDGTSLGKSAIFPPMQGETWRDRLSKIVGQNGKSMRGISIAAGQAPGYVYGILHEGKDPTITNLMKVIEAAGASPSWVILGIDNDPETEQLMELFGKLTDAQRQALRQMAEAFREP